MSHKWRQKFMDLSRKCDFYDNFAYFESKFWVVPFCVSKIWVFFGIKISLPLLPLNPEKRRNFHYARTFMSLLCSHKQQFLNIISPPFAVSFFNFLLLNRSHLYPSSKLFCHKSHLPHISPKNNNSIHKSINIIYCYHQQFHFFLQYAQHSFHTFGFYFHFRPIISFHHP